MIVFKNNGLSNLKILSSLILVSFIIGVFFITIYYTFSSGLKHNYLNIKNQFSKDNKYLALVNENGLWIKEETDNYTSIINGATLEKNNLKKITISQLDGDFNLSKMILADSADITNNNWKIDNAIFSKYDHLEKEINNLEFPTNFNYEKINSLFSNLSSLNMLELRKIKKDYESMNYSTTEINSHIQRIFSYPIYLMIMTILSATIMMNIKYDKSKVFHLIFGILLSVIIYYIHYFLGVLGKSEKIPIAVSIWMPIILLTIISSIGLIRINEK